MSICACKELQVCPMPLRRDDSPFMTIESISDYSTRGFLRAIRDAGFRACPTATCIIESYCSGLGSSRCGVRIRVYKCKCSASLRQSYRVLHLIHSSNIYPIFFIMATGLLIVAATFCLVASTCSQITGTYPVQLTATGAPNPVDGTQLSNYPLCAVSLAAPLILIVICGKADSIQQICRPPTSPDLPPLCPAPVDNRCECGPANRGNSSACEALTCNDADYLSMSSYFSSFSIETDFWSAAAALAPDLCQSLYDADPSYSAAVSTAIASATSAALKAVATANPLDFSTYPPCAVRQSTPYSHSD